MNPYSVQTAYLIENIGEVKAKIFRLPFSAEGGYFSGSPQMRLSVAGFPHSSGHSRAVQRAVRWQAAFLSCQQVSPVWLIRRLSASC